MLTQLISGPIMVLLGLEGLEVCYLLTNHISGPFTPYTDLLLGEVDPTYIQ